MIPAEKWARLIKSYQKHCERVWRRFIKGNLISKLLDVMYHRSDRCISAGCKKYSCYGERAEKGKTRFMHKKWARGNLEIRAVYVHSTCENVNDDSKWKMTEDFPFFLSHFGKSRVEKKLSAWINESGGRCTKVTAWNKVHDGEVISVTNDRTRIKSRMTKMLLSTQTESGNINIQYAMKLECVSGGRDWDFYDLPFIARFIERGTFGARYIYVIQANLLLSRCRLIPAWMCPSCEHQMSDRSSRIDKDLRGISRGDAPRMNCNSSALREFIFSGSTSGHFTMLSDENISTLFIVKYLNDVVKIDSS